MSEIDNIDKIRIATELTSELLVQILRRRAESKNMDVGTLLAEAMKNSQEADRLLDALEAKGG